MPLSFPATLSVSASIVFLISSKSKNFLSLLSCSNIPYGFDVAVLDDQYECSCEPCGVLEGGEWLRLTLEGENPCRLYSPIKKTSHSIGCLYHQASLPKTAIRGNSICSCRPTSRKLSIKFINFLKLSKSGLSVVYAFSIYKKLLLFYHSYHSKSAELTLRGLSFARLSFYL